VPKGNANHFTAQLLDELGLETVCRAARCPNRMECYAQKTATFLILGNVCTRACRFCGVPKAQAGAAKGDSPIFATMLRTVPAKIGTVPAPDPDEPRRVAEAVRRLGLRHAVITCVTRDDLADGGAEHFARTIAEIRRAAAAAGEPVAVEVLPSDFAGNAAAVDRLLAAAPEVYNHNTETVPRLFRAIRGERADYRWTLDMFRRIARQAPAVRLKTGLMLGLGETIEELLDTLADLAAAGCRMLTLGQYLRPSPAQMPVVRYVSAEEFARLGAAARRLGFTHVAAGPFVRSSYHAREMAGGDKGMRVASANAPAADAYPRAGGVFSGGACPASGE
jgi:lipoic acid synthetase